MNWNSVICVLIIASVCLPTGRVGGQEPPASAPRLNRFIELMEADRPAFGMFSQNLTARTGASIADSELDFVIIDLEHSPYDILQLEHFLLGMTNKRAIQQAGHLQPRVVPLVRIPASGREQGDFQLKQVLDTGAMGVIVPHVDTAEQARAVVQACRFPQPEGAADAEPTGKRGVGYRNAARYWGLTPAEYAERADLWPLDPRGELIVWVMIETPEAVKNCREIARTPGVGGLFIGPTDLAFSLGVSKQDPRYEAAIQQVVDIAREEKIPCGTLTDADHVQQRLQQGFRFLAVGLDGALPANVQEGLIRAREAQSE